MGVVFFDDVEGKGRKGKERKKEKKRKERKEERENIAKEQKAP